MAHPHSMSGIPECAICQNTIGQLTDEDKIEESITTPCGHNFGKTCLKLWLKTANTCPLCRAELIELKHSLIMGGDTFFQSFDKTMTASLAYLDQPLPRRVRSLEAHSGDRPGWIREIDWHLRSLAVNYHTPRITFLEESISVAAMRLERGKPIQGVLSTLSRELLAEVLTLGGLQDRDADVAQDRPNSLRPGGNNPRSRTFRASRRRDHTSP